MEICKFLAHLTFVYIICAHFSSADLPPDFFKIAHRGASKYAPENTMAAFNKAVELGATMLEMDLQQTATIAQHFDRPDIAFISESGIWNEDDASRVASYGAKAVLVGESLMRSGDVVRDLQSLQVPLKAGEAQ